MVFEKGGNVNKQEVVDLMKSSKSEQEWNDNADKVKAACGGYPDFWFGAIVLSGVMTKTLASFGASSEMKLVSL
jgi:hypothetical protein